MKTINRRTFLDIATRAGLAVAAAPCIRHGAAAADVPVAGSNRPTVVAVYYPHWHSYDHGSSWKGEGWTEWEGVKVAVPRFPGHEQPKKPSWGYFDESDPQWAAKEIDLAADHGIDVFLNCWYWYSGVQNMQEALEQGFLRAPNRDRMKFALMWANHDRRDQFCPQFGTPRTVWLPSRHSPKDTARVIDYCIEHYFRQPGYWRVNGGPFFSIFEGSKFIDQIGGTEKTRALLAAMDDRLRRAGLPPMHWSAMAKDSKAAAKASEAGFHSTSRYNVASAGKERADFTESYEDVMEAHRAQWRDMSTAPIVNMPVVTMGWDSTPRCRPDVPWPFPKKEYPYIPVVVGNTPERFEQLLKDAARHVQGDPKKPFAVLLNAWNEWTEGGYLLPEERTGNAYLEAIRRTFGKASGK